MNNYKFEAKISPRRLISYYASPAWLPALLLSLLVVGSIWLRNKTFYDSIYIYLLCILFIFLFLIPTILSLRFLLGHKSVIMVSTTDVRFDALLNQKGTKNIATEFIAVPLAKLENIYINHWDTEKSFGHFLGGNPRGVILAWNIVELKLKDGEGSYYINTLFLNKNDEQAFAQLIAHLEA